MAEPDDSPTELLLRALNHLEQPERDRVLLWLLNRVGPPDTPNLGRLLHDLRGHIPTTMPQFTPWLAEELSLATPLRGEHQVVPLRFAADQHAQLRAWCREHGFSMATVIRGLVARFLEQQGTPPTGRAEAG